MPPPRERKAMEHSTRLAARGRLSSTRSTGPSGGARPTRAGRAFSLDRRASGATRPQY
jgi:hypothetical protein